MNVLYMLSIISHKYNSVKITCKYRGKEWTYKKNRVSTLVSIIWYVLLVIIREKIALAEEWQCSCIDYIF